MIEDIRKTSTVGLTTDEVKKVCRGLAPKDREKQLLCVVEEELEQGFNFIKQYPNVVTVFGSARTEETNNYYKAAQELGGKLVTDLNAAVTTGGGPGIMEAANRGAYQVGGTSIGIGIKLPSEQKFNEFVTQSMIFHFFFTRKVIMTYSAKAYVYFPGGFGTLNEFFELLTLVQTKKIPPVPLFLYGTEYWQPLLSYIHTYLEKDGYIDQADDHLFVITDNLDEIVQGIRHFIEN